MHSHRAKPVLVRCLRHDVRRNLQFEKSPARRSSRQRNRINATCVTLSVAELGALSTVNDMSHTSHWYGISPVCVHRKYEKLEKSPADANGRESVHSCDMCAKTFSTNYSMNKHRKTHTGNANVHKVKKRRSSIVVITHETPIRMNHEGDAIFRSVKEHRNDVWQVVIATEIILNYPAFRKLYYCIFRSIINSTSK